MGVFPNVVSLELLPFGKDHKRMIHSTDFFNEDGDIILQTNWTSKEFSHMLTQLSVKGKDGKLEDFKMLQGAFSKGGNLVDFNKMINRAVEKEWDPGILAQMREGGNRI